jgi:hypothetical protein
MNVAAFWLALVAPLPYWALGLPWLDASRMRLTPLLGCALAGLCAEWAMLAGLPVRATVVLAIVLSCAVAIYRRRALAGATAAFMEWLPFYWLAVLAASLSPFPVLGWWSGDWLFMYRMGLAVDAGDLPRTLLARPPLFGGSTIPLWLLQPGFASYQLMAAMASAAVVTTTLHFMRFLRPSVSLIWLLPLVISPFFLHHTAAAWSKPLASALVLAAMIEAVQLKRLAAAVLFALAVAVHEGFIVWAPCLLLCQVQGPTPWRNALKGVVPMAAAGAVIVGPYILWIAVKYGLAAKVASNPVITDLIPIPWWQKTALGIITAFVAWDPVVVVVRWLSSPGATTGAVIAKEGYWLITSWVTTLAGTMAGFLFPFVAALRWIRVSPRPPALPALTPWISLGFGLAVVLNLSLAGDYSTQGTMQSALPPLALACYGLLVAKLVALGNEATQALRRICLLGAIVGTVPWLLLNVGISSGLWLSAGLRQRFAVGSEGDYFAVLENRLEPLGLTAFPAAACLAAVCLIASIWVFAWLQKGKEGGGHEIGSTTAS